MTSNRVQTLAWLAFGLAMLVPVLFQPGCGDQRQGISGPPREPTWLTIVTPHNERIRIAFEEAFNDWYQKEKGTSVYFDWVVLGTPECIDFIASQRGASGRGGRRSRPDLMFGGGIEDHAQLASLDLSKPFDPGEAVMAGIPEQIAGRPTRDSKGRWHATDLSSFGILANTDRLEKWGIAAPGTWADLARPEFRTWLAVADPGRSGSNRQVMVLILNKYGWEEGWSIIVRMLANARALSDRSSVVLNQVETGLSLAAPAVSFDGMALAAESDGTLTYLNPPGATTVSPGAVSLLSRSTAGATAEDFVRFCLGDTGQKLWALSAEHRGDSGQTLYHYPIKPEILSRHADEIALQGNPFADEFGVEIDLTTSARQRDVLVPFVHAICDDNHVMLQRTWQAVIEAGLPEDAVRELTAPLFSEDDAYDRIRTYTLASPAEQQQARDGWSKLFRQRLQRVLGLVR